MAKKENKEKKEKKEKKSNVASFSDIRDVFSTKWGAGSIMSLGENWRVACDVIPSQSLSLDYAIGVGGYPRGRIIEIYGPEASGKTTLALHAVASAQSLGGKAAFIDAEHALSPVLMSDMGIDPSRTLISQPDCGEQALEMCELLVESQSVDVVVVDSVAALTPLAELEGQVGQNVIGAQARMMSQFLRRIAAKVKKTNVSVIFINQIRHKIGVMFGCLHADTLINFVDGRSERIKDVVDNKIEGEVWSYNEKTDKFEPAKITNWFNNGNINDKSDFKSIYLRCPENKNGFVNITVTPNHKIMTDHGWVEADDLHIGCKVLTKQRSIINGSIGSFLRGVLSGDSHIAQAKNRQSAHLKIRDNIDIEYAKWKAEKLSLIGFNKCNYNCGTIFVSDSFSELVDIKNEYPNRDPMLLLNNFSWMGFAVWLMDDATYNRDRYLLSIKRFKGDFDKIDEISRSLDKFGLYHYASEGGRIIFDKDVSNKIANKIAEYVPNCMRHKLPKDIGIDYVDFDLSFHPECEYSKTYAEILDIRDASGRQMRNIGKYDLEVDGNHNYSAGGSTNGVIVHNSPETTPGGNALKFYASLRLDIRKHQVLKNGENIYGHEAKIKVIKNKVAVPFKFCVIPLIYGKGIDSVGDLLKLASQNNIITLKGSHYSYKEHRLGNGAAAAIAFLHENPEVSRAIETELRSLLFPDDEVVENPPIQFQDEDKDTNGMDDSDNDSDNYLDDSDDNLNSILEEE